MTQITEVLIIKHTEFDEFVDFIQFAQRLIDDICDELTEEIENGDDSSLTKESLTEALKNQDFLLRIQNRLLEQLADPASP